MIACLSQKLHKNFLKKPQKTGKTVKLKKTYNSNIKCKNPRKQRKNAGFWKSEKNFAKKLQKNLQSSFQHLIFAPEQQ